MIIARICRGDAAGERIGPCMAYARGNPVHRTAARECGQGESQFTFRRHFIRALLGAMFAKRVGAFLSIAMIAAQPAAAQDLGSIGASDISRPAAFGGVTVRLPLGRQAAAKPEARLQLTTYRMDSSQPSRMRAFNPKGLELGFSKARKPLLFAGGHNVAQAEQKMGLNTGTTLLIVAGVVVVVLVVALASGGGGLGDTCPEIDGSRDHCIDP